jgi:hypothetical protein
MDRLLVHDGVQAHGVQAQIRDVPVVAIRWLRREEPIFKILRGGISRNWRTNHGLHRDLAGHNGGARLPVAAAVVISGTSTTSQPFPGPRRILAADRQKKMGSET